MFKVLAYNGQWRLLEILEGSTLVKVGVMYVKGQLVSKGLFAVFVCTRNERNFFCIPALK